MDMLHDKAVQLNVKEVRSSDWVLILLNALPLLLLAGFVFFLMRQMQPASAGHDTWWRVPR